MQLEGDVARQRLAGSERGERRLEDFHAVGDSPEELLFFLLEDGGNAILLPPQVGVCVAHLLGNGLHKAVEERPFRTELESVPNRAPGDSPQHVPAPFVSWDDAVANRKTASADMVGDHLERWTYRRLVLNSNR